MSDTDPVVLVLGGEGVLGTAVRDKLRELGGKYNAPSRFAEWDIRHVRDCDVVINCIGAIPQKQGERLNALRVRDDLYMIEANTVVPHQLAHYAAQCGNKRVIHMSTDCVYGNTDAFPAPIDLYGATKLAGEVKQENWINVRSSFISPGAGFWKWAIDNKNNMREGWINASWNGTTVWRLAQVLIDLALRPAPRPMSGVVHVGSRHIINKYELQVLICQGEGGEWIYPIPRNRPHIRRAKIPDIVVPKIEELLSDYYNEQKRAHA